MFPHSLKTPQYLTFVEIHHAAQNKRFLSKADVLKPRCHVANFKDAYRLKNFKLTVGA